MSRSGYSDDCCGSELGRWRGAVKSAIKGKRGQAFLREMSVALDAMPVKRLIDGEMVIDGGCCAMGAVLLHRRQGTMAGYVTDQDKSFSWNIAKVLNIAPAMVKEISYQNDEFGSFCVPDVSPEKRWVGMRKWVDENLEVA